MSSVAALSALTETLRGAGCVFAEDEAEIIWNSVSNFQELESWTHRRIAGEPLEQIVGWVQFAELRLRVGPGVFVPRQRTLLLADATADLVGTINNPVVLEAFCGVAPVAATVLDRHPRTNVHVTDSNSTALSYAQANTDFRAATYQGDVLSGLAVELRCKVDVIAAVPPYVPDSEARFLPREAIDFEPGEALFGGSRGLDCIAALLSDAQAWLADEGSLLIEMNPGQVPAVLQLAAPLGYSLVEEFSSEDQTAVVRFAGS
ncbi:hypothetical protein B2J88_44490 [Rhodococcus sp. SRB_17]|nr:hypothetical protein [Rhodococcus sp. SRB_17]